jgi:four helix bundle protein
MKVKRFEDLIAWQKAIDLAELIYVHFRELKDFSFRDQICRAAVSVSNNIAEGFDRGSDADFKRFLNIARSSCNEVKSMLYLAERLHYIGSLEEQRTGEMQ